MSDNRLISSSSDNSIKVWTISAEDITLIKEIKEHTDSVYKVIPLSRERIASCSEDKTIRIWKNDETYEHVSTLEHISCVISMLQLSGQELLISSYGDINSLYNGLYFWNMNTYTYRYAIEGFGFGVEYSTHMIELPNGDVALSSLYSIIIIDAPGFKIKKEIRLEKYITKCSSLCVYNDNSLIIASRGRFVQISIKDYSILYRSKKGGRFRGYFGIIPFNGGKYFAIENYKVLTIIKPYFA